MHAAFGSQLSVFVWHSSTSEQLVPLPAYPEAQVQVRDPIVFAQVAFTSHPPFADAHSSTSAQVSPSPE